MTTFTTWAFRKPRNIDARIKGSSIEVYTLDGNVGNQGHPTIPSTDGTADYVMLELDPRRARHLRDALTELLDDKQPGFDMDEFRTRLEGDLLEANEGERVSQRITDMAMNILTDMILPKGEIGIDGAEL